MKKIIDPINRDTLKKELNKERFLRSTRKGGNEIYCVNIHNAPNVLNEIGRLREVTFRASGGGTGLELDLDTYDTSENCYEQLIVWSPEDEEIDRGAGKYINPFSELIAHSLSHSCRSAIKVNLLLFERITFSFAKILCWSPSMGFDLREKSLCNLVSSKDLFTS